MNPRDKQVVRLTPEQRQELERMVRTGTHAARALAHARVLLMTDAGDWGDGETDEAPAEGVGGHRNTVAQVRRLLAAGGLEAALRRKKPTGRQYRKLDGGQEARLIAIACSPAPDGQARWTLKLLAERLPRAPGVPSPQPPTPP